MSKRKNRSTFSPAQVDIVIPVHNNYEMLEVCLEKIPLAVKDINYTLTLVDNGSDLVQSDTFYAKKWKNLKVYKHSKALGFPKACNVGASKGYSPLIFFLNSDVWLEEDSLVTLIKSMDTPSVGVVGMKLLFPSEELFEKYNLASSAKLRPADTIQHVGLETNVYGSFYHIFLGWSADNPKANAIEFPCAVTGAAFLTRRALWKQIGGFRLEYGAGTWEDIDYCMSARKLGYNIKVDTNAVGFHFTGATSEKYDQKYPLQQNQNIFLSRWHSELAYTEWQNL